MSYITTILSILNRYHNDIDNSLYCFITTQEITKEELIVLKNIELDNNYFIKLRDSIIRYYDDRLFVNYYLIPDYKYKKLLVEEKYRYSYSNNRLYPYGTEYIRTLLMNIEGNTKDILEQYINGYTDYYKDRKKYEKIKIK